MKTLLNEEINKDCLGILYLCTYDYRTKVLTPVSAVQFKDPAKALYYYANTPNPPSQVAYASTRDKFIKELEDLHKRMQDSKWQAELAEYL